MTLGLEFAEKLGVSYKAMTYHLCDESDYLYLKEAFLSGTRQGFRNELVNSHS